MNDRFLVLADQPLGNGVGPESFGDVSGYAVIAFDDLDEAEVFCASMIDRYRRLRVVDRETYDGEAIQVVHETRRE